MLYVYAFNSFPMKRDHKLLELIIFDCDGVQDPVQAQHVPVLRLQLALRRQTAECLGHVAVHVPLHVLDVGPGEHRGHAVDHVVLHLGAGQIQNQDGALY